MCLGCIGLKTPPTILSQSRIQCSSDAPKGFGKKPDVAPPPRKKTQPAILGTPLTTSSSSAAAERERREAEDDVIPEVVTDRILKRLTITIGLPLFLGVGFFPLFYYLKVIRHVDIPEWLPLLSSSLTFGLAALGITYGVISTSWDPEREGSFLGWKEAKANWPVFTQTFSRKKR